MTTSRSRLEEVNKLDLHDVADLLGIDLTYDRRHLASCPACGAAGHGSANVFRSKKTGHHRWHCHRCNEGGGVADLAALTLLDAWWRDLDSEQRDEVAADVLDEAPTPTPPRSHPSTGTHAHPTAPTSSPPSVADIQEVWDRCGPAAKDPDVRRWLNVDRRLDAAALDDLDLCRALPRTGRALPVAVPWQKRHRCIVPAYDATGELVTLRPRCLDGGGPKTMTPRGGWPPGGAVMANHHGLDVLLGELEPKRVIVVEGEPDFLTAALTWPHEAILGMWEGSWSPEMAEAIPDDVDVLIMTHADESGDKYAEDIATSGRGRWHAYRVRSEDDLNDRHIAGTLPEDPSEEAVLMGPKPPTPLRPHVAVRPFPVEQLPDPFAAFVRALATSTQTPPDLAALLSLSTLSLTLLHKATLKIRDDWTERPTLYTVVAMPPSSTKSPVFRAVTKPLRDFEDAAYHEFGIAKREHAHRVERLKGEIKVAERAVGAASDPEARSIAEEEVRAASEVLATLVEPRLKRLITNDATPEALARLLFEQDERMGVFDDEGTIFQLLAGLYSGKVPNTSLFKKAWDGSSHMVDRKKDDALLLACPLLAVGLAVQPLVVERAVENEHNRGTGVAARFCYAIPESRVGARDMEPEPIAPEVKHDYHALIGRLLMLAEERDERGRLVPHQVEMEPEALELFVALRRELEPRMGEGGDLHDIGDWVGKLPSHIASIALILHVVTANEDEGDPRSHPVREETMRRAVEIGRYLIPHAQVALWGRDERYQLGKAILGWLAGTRESTFTESEIREHLRSRMKGRDKSVLSGALQQLEDHGYIERGTERPKKGPGRKRGPTWVVSPEWDWKVP